MIRGIALVLSRVQTLNLKPMQPSKNFHLSTKLKHIIVLLTVTVLYCASAYSQINKGTKVLGTNLNFSSSTSNNDYNLNPTNNNASESQRFSISPNVGYFIAPNFAVGIKAGYMYSANQQSLSNTSTSYTSKSKNNTFSVTPYLRRYFSLSEKFLLFTELNIGYANSFGKNVQTTGSSVSEYAGREQSFNVSFAPGINYFLSNKIALEAGFGNLGYTLSQTKQNQTNQSSTADVIKNTSSVTQLNFSMSSITIGVKYFISK